MYYGYGNDSRNMNEKEIECLNKPKKRERKIFPNAMLCHVWANESQHEGSNKSIKPSLWFRGTEIFSYGYHYLAGKIYTREDGTKYALLNNNFYSNSTAKHMIDIRAALRGKMEYFNVADPSDPMSEKNEDHINNEIVDMIQSLFETRKQYYCNVTNISLKINEANTELAFLGLPKIELTQEQWNDLEFLQGERDALNNCPIKNAKRDKARVKRKQQLEIKYAYEIASYRTFDPTKGIEDFREFRTSHVVSTIGYDHPAYLTWRTRELLRKNGIILQAEIHQLKYDILRVKDKLVQTSKGAEVPLSHAIRLLKMILKGDVVRGERVGLFTLDAILDDPKGDKTIKIGCHKILLSEAVSVLKPYMLEIVK